MNTKQTGSALIMSLVILMVLTILATSSMSTSQLNEKMVSAVQFMGQAFQETKSEINADINYFVQTDIEPLNTAWSKPLETLSLDGNANKAGNAIGNMVQRIPDAKSKYQYTKTISITYLREGTPPSGYSLDSYVGLQYDLQVSSTLNDVSSSDQSRGFNFAAPKL